MSNSNEEKQQPTIHVSSSIMEELARQQDVASEFRAMPQWKKACNKVLKYHWDKVIESLESIHHPTPDTKMAELLETSTIEEAAKIIHTCLVLLKTDQYASLESTDDNWARTEINMFVHKASIYADIAYKVYPNLKNTIEGVDIIGDHYSIPL